MKKPELLAPAGDSEKLRTAVHYGADAVYLGDSRFSLRSRTGNFTPDELGRAIEYAHQHGVKAFVTINIFPHNRDLQSIDNHIDLLKEIRPDAVVLSDPGVFMKFRAKAPALDVHISTQANVTNREAAGFWEKQGASRIVLSRELSIEEIRKIRDNTTLELEVFVHGSICISYSGRCYISSFLASRGANMGECTNSCRWNYALMEEKRQGEYLPVYENDRGTYLMSSRDLCMIEYLPLLAEAGVDSFKIEGRMKGINYVAGVVKSYREAVDKIESKFDPDDLARWMRELRMLSNRGFTTGMFFGKQPEGHYNIDEASYRMSHELVGVILDTNRDYASISLRNRLDTGDGIEYLSPGHEGKTYKVESIRDQDGALLSSARNGDVVIIPAPGGIRQNDLVRRQKKNEKSDNVHQAASVGAGVNTEIEKW